MPYDDAQWAATIVYLAFSRPQKSSNQMSIELMHSTLQAQNYARAIIPLPKITYCRTIRILHSSFVRFSMVAGKKKIMEPANKVFQIEMNKQQQSW